MTASSFGPGLAVVTALATSLAVLLLSPGGHAPGVPGREAAPGRAGTPPAAGRGHGGDGDRRDDRGPLLRHRAVLTLLAGSGVVAVLGGATGVALGAAAGAGCWWAAGRVEPAGARARREEVRRRAPHVVALFAAALRAGAAPAPALLLVADALPGPATDPVRAVASRLALGADPAGAWRGLLAEPGLEAWGRAMARAHESGASVVDVVERLADDLAGTARVEVEDRARTVGVRAALPLGLCLLPAFLLVGIVPLVAGLLGSLW